MITDPYTGEHRETLKADFANAAILIDYLDNIDVYERHLRTGPPIHDGFGGLPGAGHDQRGGCGDGAVLPATDLCRRGVVRQQSRRRTGWP